MITVLYCCETGFYLEQGVLGFYSRLVVTDVTPKHIFAEAEAEEITFGLVDLDSGSRCPGHILQESFWMLLMNRVLWVGPRGLLLFR